MNAQLEEVTTVGLSEHVVRDGVVDADAFTIAMRDDSPVGVCHCGGLLDGYVEQAGAIVWFIGRCPAGHELPAPNGRVAARARGHRVRALPSAEVLQAWRDRDARILGERPEAA